MIRLIESLTFILLISGYAYAVVGSKSMGVSSSVIEKCTVTATGDDAGSPVAVHCEAGTPFVVDVGTAEIVMSAKENLLKEFDDIASGYDSYLLKEIEIKNQWCKAINKKGPGNAATSLSGGGGSGKDALKVTITW
jgi:hypothetical protein